MQRDCVKVAFLQSMGGGGPGGAAARVVSRAVYWFFTGLLIVASAGIAGYTGYLVRRLFTTEPAEPAS